MTSDQTNPASPSVTIRVTIPVPQLYGSYRIHSITRPGVGAGLPIAFAGTGRRGFTREQLEALDAEALGFYIDGFQMEGRGDERYTEEFVLQGALGLDRDTWETIKPIIPLAGEDPNEYDDDSDDFDDSPEAHEKWQNRQDALAEEAEERRRYPEESDDDYDGFGHTLDDEFGQ